MIPIALKGTAFQAVSTRETNYSKDELKSEEININRGTNTLNLVAFKDFKSGETITVSLSKTNLSKLKDNFSEDNFFMRDDGITRLSGKAESFVSGWYQDIAYNREFLRADKNDDGRLNDNEYQNTRNEFDGNAIDYLRKGSNSNFILEASIEYIEKNYIQVKDKNKSSQIVYDRKAKNIEDELNTTLRIDENLDSKITLSEAYKVNNPNLSSTEILKEHIKEWYGNKVKIDDSLVDKSKKISNESDLVKEIILDDLNKLDIDSIYSSIKNDLKEKFLNGLIDKLLVGDNEKEETKAKEATQKLIASNGNEAVLSQEEREAISAEITTIKIRVKEDMLNQPLLDIKA